MRKVALFALVFVLLLATVGSAVAERIGDHGGRSFTTTLTGAAEAPGPGDPDGSGTATITLNHGQGEVCWEINVSGITLPATAAHIHVAPAGEPGPVVVPLSAPDASGSSSGCLGGVSQDLIKAIIQNPEAYYVNVHTLPLYGAGALRGQLSK